MSLAKDTYDALFGECNTLIGQVQALVNEAINNNAQTTVAISPLLDTMKERIQTASLTISTIPDPSTKKWLFQQLEQMEVSYSVLHAQFQELVSV
jgi:hypothetical protein